MEPTDEDKENLARAEKARALLITAADGLRAKLRSANAEQMSRALYFCLKELGAEDAQAAQVEAIWAERGIPAAEEAAREWNVVMGLLDEMASLLGGQSVTIPEYEELFGLLLRSSDLGHIPQTLDAWCWPAQARCALTHRTMSLCWASPRANSPPRPARRAC